MSHWLTLRQQYANQIVRGRSESTLENILPRVEEKLFKVAGTCDMGQVLRGPVAWSMSGHSLQKKPLLLTPLSAKKKTQSWLGTFGLRGQHMGIMSKPQTWNRISFEWGAEQNSTLQEVQAVVWSPSVS